MAKKTVLNRYERTPGGDILIDVAATRVEDLYNDFDKGAPYIRRDLDQDLGEYLIGCAREIKRESFVLRLTLTQPPDEDSQSRIRRSITAYFHYLAEGERQKVMQMFRRSAILFAIGLGILFLSVSVNHSLGTQRSVIANVLAEGLTVAAWVSLWESLAIFLIEWFPHRRNLLLCRRLAEADLLFRSAGA